MGRFMTRCSDSWKSKKNEHRTLNRNSGSNSSIDLQKRDRKYQILIPGLICSMLTWYGQTGYHCLKFGLRWELKFAGLQLIAEKANLFFDRTVLLYTAFNAVDRMQCGGMIAVEGFSDALQGRIGIVP